MTTTDKIIIYLHKKTKGMVTITPAIAAGLVTIVKENITAYAILHRYDMQRKSWEVMRNIPTTIETINQLIIKALDTRPVENCYRYDLYDHLDKWQGQILTINPDLL